MFIISFAFVSCNEIESSSSSGAISDLTGKWQNISDESDVFTFKADKSGSYAYRYIDYTDPTTAQITYFPTSGVASYDFDYYTLEYIGGYYELTFFGSPFPITNATAYMLEGYLHIKYDWSDYRGKEWFDVVELYKKIDE